MRLSHICTCHRASPREMSPGRTLIEIGHTSKLTDKGTCPLYVVHTPYHPLVLPIVEADGALTVKADLMASLAQSQTVNFFFPPFCSSRDVMVKEDK